MHKTNSHLRRLVRGVPLGAFFIVLCGCLGTVNNACAEEKANDVAAPSSIDAIYADLGNRYLWWEPASGLTPRGSLLVDVLSHADREGLSVSDYLPQDKPDADNQPLEVSAREYDRRLTKGLLHYISDVRDGRQSARNVDSEFVAIPRQTDTVALLKAGLQETDFAAWLASLPPHDKHYRNLRGHLERYRNLANLKWPPLVRGKNLEFGANDPNVHLIRQRLKLLGDFSIGDAGEEDSFDETLLTAVVRFQTRHGLATDGIIGPQTYAALNVSLATRIRQIIINMERLRWLPERLGPRHVMVNIARFELSAVSGDIEVLRMPVIVGRDQRRTPILNDKIINIVFRPTWAVPVKIARNDLLPKIKADANYLMTMGIRVFQSWQEGAPEVDPQSVDWSAMPSKQLGFKFRQDSGPKNALGLIRFTLTNPYDIYLHDTPDKSLFDKPGRAFSSGCIRASDVVALANFALEPLMVWNPEAIRDAMNNGETRIVKLPVPLPIFIIYSTVVAEDTDTLHFREDVYGRDAALMRALGLGVGG